MSISREILKALMAIARHPRRSIHSLSQLTTYCNGISFTKRLNLESQYTKPCDWSPQESKKVLRRIFDSKKSGHGILKWEHYFEIYERHFARFSGKDVHIMEVGVYSGGSLEMWNEYFGPKCHIYGVDIEPACKSYQKDNVQIFIGDQQDRHFWQNVKTQIPFLDILIDDGGHLPQQQIITLEEMLPHLRPGGVFLCEDIHGDGNEFSTFVRAIADELNTIRWVSPVRDQALAAMPTPFQQAISSVHLYPYIAVFERSESSISQFTCTRRGSQWQPHMS